MSCSPKTNFRISCLTSNHHACQQSVQHQRAVRQKACGTSALRGRALNKTLYPPHKLTLCLCSSASRGHPVPLSTLTDLLCSFDKLGKPVAHSLVASQKQRGNEGDDVVAAGASDATPRVRRHLQWQRHRQAWHCALLHLGKNRMQVFLFYFYFEDVDDDELMLNVLRCHETY